MNKLPKTLKIVATIAIVLAFLSVALIVIERYSIQTGLHTYTYFGDGRFEIWSRSNENGDNRLLVDTKPISSDTLVARIERYYQKDDLIYMKGFYSDDYYEGATNSPFFAQAFDSDEMIVYESTDEIPRYMILNYHTIEAKFYLTLEDVPENQRKYFTKDLNLWCDIMKTCYEAE